MSAVATAPAVHRLQETLALPLAVFVVYLVLIVRAVRRPEPVDCGCFGALGDSEVTRMTVWRNVLLVVQVSVAEVQVKQRLRQIVDVFATRWQSYAAKLPR